MEIVQYSAVVMFVLAIKLIIKCYTINVYKIKSLLSGVLRFIVRTLTTVL